MKYILSDYLAHKEILQSLLDRNTYRDKREIASEYSACAGVPLAVMLTYLQDITKEDRQKEINDILKFFGAELV